MSQGASRLHHQATYGPLKAKNLQTVLRQELRSEFGFEHMGLIADALIQRFFELLDEYSPERLSLLPGQVLWLAARKDQRGGPGKTMRQTALVPVKLTLVAPEDLEQLADQRKIPRELRPEIAARLLREAYQQGGVLALTDLTVLLGITATTAQATVHAYEKQHGVTLPYRGVLHDLGRTTSHKVRAVELHLKGKLTQAIAREIHHDPRSVDLYLTDFERVYELHQEGKSAQQIAYFIKRSVGLVKEYLELIQCYLEPEPDTPSGKSRGAKARPPQAKRTATPRKRAKKR